MRTLRPSAHVARASFASAAACARHAFTATESARLSHLATARVLSLFAAAVQESYAALVLVRQASNGFPALTVGRSPIPPSTSAPGQNAARSFDDMASSYGFGLSPTPRRTPARNGAGGAPSRGTRPACRRIFCAAERGTERSCRSRW